MPRLKPMVWMYTVWLHSLRGDLVARAYVPSKPTRQRKEVLRQRLYWARLRTRVRNRIHALIDRQGELSMPQCSDLFGRKGLNALNKLCLNDRTRRCCAKNLRYSN